MREPPVSEDIYEFHDARFGACVKRLARLEQLYTGCRWAEGPAWFSAHRTLVWSDIPNDRMLRWDETTGAVAVFREPCGYANGATIDRQGRLLSCEHGGRRVSRTEHDGRVVTLADRVEGKRLNSPNDLVVRSDGSIWFTDPTYGIDGWYEGEPAEPEIEGCHVYRIDPATGAVSRVADDFLKPNGLAFSPDERRLYISDTGGAGGLIRVFDVGDDGGVSGGEALARYDGGHFDGFRVDEEGRIWTSAGAAVHCYAPDGTLLGAIRTPEPVANVVFGGARRNRLFITATTSLYAVLLPVRGAATF
jgi:gluconolactonase